ncbi:MAG: hypothetical protein WDN06_03175 [Asticcacaulis sp.]
MILAMVSAPKLAARSLFFTDRFGQRRHDAAQGQGTGVEGGHDAKTFMM